ncbi:MAG: hypothetical protein V4635_17275 [Bacteroidota bacterium]
MLPRCSVVFYFCILMKIHPAYLIPLALFAFLLQACDDEDIVYSQNHGAIHE